MNPQHPARKEGPGVALMLALSLAACGQVLAVEHYALQWATWLGGNGNDSQEASIRLDKDNNVFVLPYTLSADAPTTAGAHDRTYNGGADYYLAKLSPDGRQLLYGTYLGGSGDEYLNTHNLAVDREGNAYISVSTGSTNFPTTPGAYDRSYNGGAIDWGIAKFSSTGTLLASTFIGGSGADNPDGIYVDDRGNVFCTGASDSPDFPTTAGAYQATKGAGMDAVLVRLKNDFTGLLYGTFIGGAANEDGRSGYLDAAGQCYIVGQSPGAGWPVVNAYQRTYAGGALDCIVAKFAPPNPALRRRSPNNENGASHLN